jgi:hypothetical protein
VAAPRIALVVGAALTASFEVTKSLDAKLVSSDFLQGCTPRLRKAWSDGRLS